MVSTNLYAAWIGIFLGCIAGAIPGLFFHNDDWLGGYSSWPRRMVRLGHISFFGIAFINFCFATTVHTFGVAKGTALPGHLLVVAAVTMPLVCYLSAFRKGFRHLFFIPTGSAFLGIALFLWRILQG